MADMKKTLQKELLRNNPLSPEKTKLPNDDFIGGASGPPLNLPELIPNIPKNRSDSCSSEVMLTDVNFQYLKHVIFKFFTSREHEVSFL